LRLQVGAGPAKLEPGAERYGVQSSGASVIYLPMPMKLLSRAKYWSAKRPLHHVRCGCGREFIVCGHPGDIRKRKHCKACMPSPRAHA
jgi:hypothetical protein